jgi:hypothetical protein
MTEQAHNQGIDHKDIQSNWQKRGPTFRGSSHGLPLECVCIWQSYMHRNDFTRPGAASLALPSSQDLPGKQSQQFLPASENLLISPLRNYLSMGSCPTSWLEILIELAISRWKNWYWPEQI